MAELRMELLVVVVLTGTLLMVSVRGWEKINENWLLDFYDNDQLGEDFNLQSVQFTPPREEQSDEDEDKIPEDALPEAEGAATTEEFNTSDKRDIQEKAASGTRDLASMTNSFQERSVEFPPRRPSGTKSTSSPGLDVVCSEAGFKVNLSAGSLSEIKVLGSKGLLSVMEAPQSCGYYVNPLQRTFTVPFTGCNVKQQTDGYSLQLLYIDDLGQIQIATASCDQKFDSGTPRAGGGETISMKCANPTARLCDVVGGEQVACGTAGISSSDCLKLGCCVNTETSGCYYPLDECTTDQHFVFAIRSDSASIPVVTSELIIPGMTTAPCIPVILTETVAIFKFKITECGARAFVVGETDVYLAEVQSTVKVLELKYGLITRSDPLRFIVECRYAKGGTTATNAIASIGYKVTTPMSVWPSGVESQGLYGVQLRIATDDTFTSYYPTDHQPLSQILGKPVYLELLLTTKKADAVILVNYCLAYPRSATNALVLVYEGCANPFDPQVSILQVSDLPTNRYQRRFIVEAFQFMDQKTNKYLDEDIYFMCSTEVCFPDEKTCQQQCFDAVSND